MVDKAGGYEVGEREAQGRSGDIKAGRAGEKIGVNERRGLGGGAVKYEGVEGARMAYARAKVRGDMDEADKIRDFIFALKKLWNVDIVERVK